MKYTYCEKCKCNDCKKRKKQVLAYLEKLVQQQWGIKDPKVETLRKKILKIVKQK